MAPTLHNTHDIILLCSWLRPCIQHYSSQLVPTLQSFVAVGSDPACHSLQLALTLHIYKLFAVGSDPACYSLQLASTLQTPLQSHGSHFLHDLISKEASRSSQLAPTLRTQCYSLQLAPTLHTLSFISSWLLDPAYVHKIFIPRRWRLQDLKLYFQSITTGSS